jgi:transcriptional regulator with XRE-family HTH domain
MSIPELKAYRESRNLSQEALAAELRVARGTLNRWETGARKIKPALVMTISEKTGIPREVLRPDFFGER